MTNNTQITYQLQVCTEGHVLLGELYRTLDDVEKRIGSAEQSIRRWAYRLGFNEATLLIVEGSRDYYEGEVVSYNEKTVFTKHMIMKLDNN